MPLDLYRVPRMRVTWPVLVATISMALVGLAGGLGPVDSSVARALVGDRAHPGRESAQLVAIDAATLDRLGPLPWTAEVWTEVDERLRQTGLAEVHLVDPVAPLIKGEGAASAESVIRVPTVVQRVRGRRVPHLPEAWGPLTVEPVVLDLPRVNGSVVGLGEAAAGPRSAWCTWTPCPTGPTLTTPLAAADAARIPTLSLATVLDGGAIIEQPGALVLLGVTAPGWSHQIPVGPEGLDVSWPEAVALAAGAATGPQIPAPGPLLLAPLLALLVLLGGLAARAERLLPAEAWIAVVPVVSAGAGALLVALGFAVVPVVSLAVAGVLGPLVVALGARQRALRFVRRAALQVSRGDLGFAWEQAIDGSPAGLLRALGSLTRNHLPSDRMAWLRPAKGGRVEVVGGWGLSASDLVSERLTLRAVTAMARHPRAAGLLRDGSDRAVLVPLHGPGGEVRGWWCVTWGVDDAAPDLDVLVDLAAWVASRIEGESGGAVRSWLRLDGELRAIGTAFARSAQARASQARVLAEAELPLATADRAGAIVFRNEAWRRHLQDLGVPGEPASLREIAWRLGGEDQLDERMRALFVDDEVVRVGDAGVEVHLAAAGDGFVAWATPPARAARPDVGAAEVIPVAREPRRTPDAPADVPGRAAARGRER